MVLTVPSGGAGSPAEGVTISAYGAVLAAHFWPGGSRRVAVSGVCPSRRLPAGPARGPRRSTPPGSSPRPRRALPAEPALPPPPAGLPGRRAGGPPPRCRRAGRGPRPFRAAGHRPAPPAQAGEVTTTHGTAHATRERQAGAMRPFLAPVSSSASAGPVLLAGPGRARSPSLASSPTSTPTCRPASPSPPRGVTP
jgi:hypothetical protein